MGSYSSADEFLLKSTKHFIPHNQEHAHVFIKIFCVAGMMYAVMRRRNEHILQPTQFIHQLGMHQGSPNLCCRIHKNNIKRFKTKKGRGKKYIKRYNGSKTEDRKPTEKFMLQLL